MKGIYPSLIAADQLNLQAAIELLDPYATGFHIDVMDNHFVPNLTWGPLVINPIARTTSRPLWVHLMVDNPTRWLDMLTLTPGSMVTFHVETQEEKPALIQKIKERSWRPGIAINPSTAINTVMPFLASLDHVLLMSVQPGFSGQLFLEHVLEKIDPLIGYRQTSNYTFTIAMDGGITEKNIAQILDKGVEQCAIGSTIFNDQDPVTILKKLQMIGKKNEGT